MSISQGTEGETLHGKYRRQIDLGGGVIDTVRQGPRRSGDQTRIRDLIKGRLEEEGLVKNRGGTFHYGESEQGSRRNQPSGEGASEASLSGGPRKKKASSQTLRNRAVAHARSRFK